MSDLKQRVELVLSWKHLNRSAKELIRELVKREAALTETVKFYASSESYTKPMHIPTKARATLKSLGIEGKG